MRVIFWMSTQMHLTLKSFFMPSSAGAPLYLAWPILKSAVPVHTWGKDSPQRHGGTEDMAN